MGRKILGIDCIQPKELKNLFFVADQLRKATELNETGLKVPIDFLKGKLMGTLFFEPSTRTRLSFESAMKRLGGEVVSVENGSSSSAKKGETIHDTLLTVGSYVDVIVSRSGIECKHWLKSNLNSHLINAGDGSNEHPTQTLTDLYTIWRKFGKVSNLKIGITGDLEHGRTVHSFCKSNIALDLRNELVLFGSKMPEKYISYNRNLIVVKKSDAEFLKEFPSLDVLYLTRTQDERNGGNKNINFVLNHDILKSLPEKSIVMHPLPRREELPQSIDQDDRAIYFEQTKNGMFIRMALLCMIFNVSPFYINTCPNLNYG